MWLGEQITERGIGNGITMIIVAGIIAGLPRAIGNTLEMVRSGEMNPLIVLLILVVVILVTLFCVFVERAQRKIQVNYAKRQVGRRMMQGQSTHLPFKLNMAGVIPPIFASSLLVFPATIAQFFGNSPNPECHPADLAKDRCRPQLWSTAARLAVRAADHRICVLLRGPGVRRARYGREPEEGRRLHSGHSSRASRPAITWTRC